MSPDPPVISVIIASVGSPSELAACLQSLAQQEGDVRIEVIVADRVGQPTARLVAQEFPWVRLLSFPADRTIPALRAAALAQSRGRIVAVIEDHCVADPRWLQEIIRAHGDHPDCAAIGGAVENGRHERLVDRAAFFCEYSQYMPPLPRGYAEAIPGNNASYKRQAFEGDEGRPDALAGGFWEFTLHQRLRERGDRFFLEPAIVVYHNKPFGFRYFLRQRFHYSRQYAGGVVAGATLGRRVIRGLASLGLPLLLLARIVTQTAHKGRSRQLLGSLPVLGAFTVAWAMGEMVGCLFGPGHSLVVVE
jgi:GT2 family glycosyltransferase